MRACIFLEYLVSGPFKNILAKLTAYFQYINEPLLINPLDTDLHVLEYDLNKVEIKIYTKGMKTILHLS